MIMKLVCPNIEVSRILKAQTCPGATSKHSVWKETTPLSWTHYLRIWLRPTCRAQESKITWKKSKGSSKKLGKQRSVISKHSKTFREPIRFLEVRAMLHSRTCPASPSTLLKPIQVSIPVNTNSSLANRSPTLKATLLTTRQKGPHLILSWLNELRC